MEQYPHFQNWADYTVRYEYTAAVDTLCDGLRRFAQVAAAAVAIVLAWAAGWVGIAVLLESSL